MAGVLHILPHPGGGGERYVDLLAGVGDLDAARTYVTGERGWLAGAPGIAARLPRNASAARAADLRHAHGDMAAMLSLPLLSRPSLWTTHGLHFLRRAEGTRRRAAERGLAAVVRRCALTVCCSRSERDDLATFLPAELEPRLRVVPNGVELPQPPAGEERAVARAALGIAPDRVAVLYLGELEPRKEPLTLVEAARVARGGGAPIVLLVAGDGPLRAEIDPLADDGLRVLGQRSDVARLLAAADVFCLPSAREGLAFALLEAMAAGVAPVVSDISGNREAVGEEAGVVVPLGDAGALANALTRLAGDGDERRRLGSAARARVADRFTLAAMRSETAALYAEALGRSE